MENLKFDVFRRIPKVFRHGGYTPDKILENLINTHHLTQLMKRNIYHDKRHTEWRKKILAKFNNKCVVCRGTNRLTAHHIITAWQEDYRYDLTNGIALCARHHSNFGQCLSPHNENALLFALFLEENFKEVWDAAKANFRRLAKDSFRN